MLIHPVLFTILSEASEKGDQEKAIAILDLMREQIDLSDASLLFLKDFSKKQQEFFLSFREDLDNDFLIPAGVTFEGTDSYHHAMIKSLVEKGVIYYRRDRWDTFIKFRKTIILGKINQAVAGLWYPSVKLV